MVVGIGQRRASSPGGPCPRKVLKCGRSSVHSSFREGEVTRTFGSGEKVSSAVKFVGMGPKIRDPRLAPIEALES